MDMFNVDLRNKSVKELKALKKHFTKIQARAKIEFEATFSPLEHNRVKECQAINTEIKARIKHLENI